MRVCIMKILLLVVILLVTYWQTSASRVLELPLRNKRWVSNQQSTFWRLFRVLEDGKRKFFDGNHRGHTIQEQVGKLAVAWPPSNCCLPPQHGTYGVPKKIQPVLKVTTVHNSDLPVAKYPFNNGFPKKPQPSRRVAKVRINYGVPVYLKPTEVENVRYEPSFKPKGTKPIPQVKKVRINYGVPVYLRSKNVKSTITERLMGQFLPKSTVSKAFDSKPIESSAITRINHTLEFPRDLSLPNWLSKEIFDNSNSLHVGLNPLHQVPRPVEFQNVAPPGFKLPQEPLGFKHGNHKIAPNIKYAQFEKTTPYSELFQLPTKSSINFRHIGLELPKEPLGFKHGNHKIASNLRLPSVKYAKFNKTISYSELFQLPTKSSINFRRIGLELPKEPLGFKHSNHKIASNLRLPSVKHAQFNKATSYSELFQLPTKNSVTFGHTVHNSNKDKTQIVVVNKGPGSKVNVGQTTFYNYFVSSNTKGPVSSENLQGPKSQVTEQPPPYYQVPISKTAHVGSIIGQNVPTLVQTPHNVNAVKMVSHNMKDQSVSTEYASTSQLDAQTTKTQPNNFQPLTHPQGPIFELPHRNDFTTGISIIQVPNINKIVKFKNVHSSNVGKQFGMIKNTGPIISNIPTAQTGIQVSKMPLYAQVPKNQANALKNTKQLLPYYHVPHWKPTFQVPYRNDFTHSSTPALTTMQVPNVNKRVEFWNNTGEQVGTIKNTGRIVSNVPITHTVLQVPNVNKKTSTYNTQDHSVVIEGAPTKQPNRNNNLHNELFTTAEVPRNQVDNSKNAEQLSPHSQVPPWKPPFQVPQHPHRSTTTFSTIQVPNINKRVEFQDVHSNIVEQIASSVPITEAVVQVSKDVDEKMPSYHNKGQSVPIGAVPTTQFNENNNNIFVSAQIPKIPANIFYKSEQPLPHSQVPPWKSPFQVPHHAHSSTPTLPTIGVPNVNKRVEFQDVDSGNVIGENKIENRAPIAPNFPITQTPSYHIQGQSIPISHVSITQSNENKNLHNNHFVNNLKKTEQPSSHFEVPHRNDFTHSSTAALSAVQVSNINEKDEFKNEHASVNVGKQFGTVENTGLNVPITTTIAPVVETTLYTIEGQSVASVQLPNVNKISSFEKTHKNNVPTVHQHHHHNSLKIEPTVVTNNGHSISNALPKIVQAPSKNKLHQITQKKVIDRPFESGQISASVVKEQTKNIDAGNSVSTVPVISAPGLIKVVGITNGNKTSHGSTNTTHYFTNLLVESPKNIVEGTNNALTIPKVSTLVSLHTSLPSNLPQALEDNIKYNAQFVPAISNPIVTENNKDTSQNQSTHTQTPRLYERLLPNKEKKFMFKENAVLLSKSHVNRVGSVLRKNIVASFLKNRTSNQFNTFSRHEDDIGVEVSTEKVSAKSIVASFFKSKTLNGNVPVSNVSREESRSDIPIEHEFIAKKPGLYNKYTSAIFNRGKVQPQTLGSQNKNLNIKKNVTSLYNVSNSSRYIIRNRFKPKNVTRVDIVETTTTEAQTFVKLTHAKNILNVDTKNQKVLKKVIKRPVGYRKNVVIDLINKERGNLKQNENKHV